MNILSDFQDRLGYRFQDVALLTRALTHPSFANEQNTEDNQTLEFLGDAVLGLVASVVLIETCPLAKEGELSRRRAAMVNATALAAIGQRLEIGPLLLVSEASPQKPSMLADAVEALIGAIYLEGGYGPCEKVLRKWLVIADDDATALGDCKSRLQVWAQQNFGVVPVYRVDRETGPQHERNYEISVVVQERVLGTGSGRSKKVAEQQAASKALVELKDA